MEVKKLHDFLKKRNEKEMIDLLSYKQFEEFSVTKNNYNQKYTSLFFDIKNNYKKEFKLFLIGIFHDNIELRCYLIHKNKGKKDKYDIISVYDHKTALKIKKIYFLQFNKNIIDEFNDKSIIKYMHYLLSDYFFPNVESKHYEKICDQLIDMDKNNSIDENLLYYYFQLPNEILIEIFNFYKKKSTHDIREFIYKFFKGDIQTILINRIMFINSFPQYLSLKVNNAAKNRDSWELTKIIILNKELENVKNIINLNLINKNIQVLFNNIIEFNQHKIYLSDIIKYMKFNISIPYLYILNIYKLTFQEYIKTFNGKMNTSYSKWADYLENDLIILGNFINDLFFQKNNTFDFKFEATLLIAFVIKFLFEYSTFIIENINNFKNNLNDYTNFHNEIIHKISVNWKTKELHFFQKFFSSDIKSQINKILHIIIEIALPFFEDENKFIDKNKYLSLENSKIGNEIRYSLKNIKYKDAFYLKKIDLETLNKINQIIDDIGQSIKFLKNNNFKKKINPNWKIIKKDNFFITYNNKSIDYFIDNQINK